MKTELLKLSAKNGWERLTYLVDNKTLQNIKEVIVLVNGKNKSFKVKKTIRHAGYNDMGIHHTVSAPDFCISVRNELGFVEELSLFDLIQKKVKVFVEDKNIERQGAL